MNGNKKKKKYKNNQKDIHDAKKWNETDNKKFVSKKSKFKTSSKHKNKQTEGMEAEEETSKKSIKQKKRKKNKKLSAERKEELLRRVTWDSVGPLTEFDFSDESIPEVEPNEQIVEEVSTTYHPCYVMPNHLLIKVNGCVAILYL